VLPPGEAARRPGSVGKPMRGVDVRIVDDAGAAVPAGTIGEITLRIAAGERRYWNDPDATARTWRDGWVHTGDLGRMDDDGFLYVVDRAKDVIIRGGYNVASAEVEAAIHELADVAECAVVGVPHPVLGQDVAVMLRLRDGAGPISLPDLRAHLADRLAGYKLPRVLVLTTDPLPRNAAGKVDKPAATALVAAGVREPARGGEPERHRSSPRNTR
jgi:long-chain acyl-CoA synthetase